MYSPKLTGSYLTGHNFLNNGDILTAIIEQTSHTNTGVLSFGGKNNPVLSFAGVANVMGSGSYGKCKPPM